MMEVLSYRNVPVEVYKFSALTDGMFIKLSTSSRLSEVRTTLEKAGYKLGEFKEATIRFGIIGASLLHEPGNPTIEELYEDRRKRYHDSVNLDDLRIVLKENV